MKTEKLAERLIEVETESPVTDADKFEPVHSFLSGHGFEYEMHSHGGVKSLTAGHGSGHPSICLCGHYDVVPAEEDWSVTGPFTPLRREGRLYGRGASDMKGGLAAQMLAFVDLAENEDFQGRVTLMVTGDEELGGPEGAASLLEQSSEYEVALIAEPTDMKVQTGFRGKIHLDLMLRGSGGHASRPEEAENPVDALPGVIEALQSIEWGKDSTPLPPTTSAVTQLETANPQNSIPSEIRIGMDVRNDTSHGFESVKEKMEQEMPDVDYSVELDHQKPPVMVEDEELIGSLENAFRSVRGRNPALTTEGGSSDGAHFSRHGVPSLEIGPQQGSIHGPDEYCRIEDIRDLRRILEETCLNLSRR